MTLAPAPIPLPVVLETADGAAYPAQLEALSPDGLSVRCEYLLPASTVCHVTGELRGERFSLDATVRRARDLGDAEGLDIELQEPPRKTEALLGDLLHRAN